MILYTSVAINESHALRSTVHKARCVLCTREDCAYIGLPSDQVRSIIQLFKTIASIVALPYLEYNEEALCKSLIRYIHICTYSMLTACGLMRCHAGLLEIHQSAATFY